MISAEITSYIAEAIRDDIKDILGQSSIFSTFQDASQTWKTKSEKQLFYTKMVIRGKPTELILKCVHIYGWFCDNF